MRMYVRVVAEQARTRVTKGKGGKQEKVADDGQYGRPFTARA